MKAARFLLLCSFLGTLLGIFFNPISQGFVNVPLSENQSNDNQQSTNRETKTPESIGTNGSSTNGSQTPSDSKTGSPESNNTEPDRSSNIPTNPSDQKTNDRTSSLPKNKPPTQADFTNQITLYSVICMPGFDGVNLRSSPMIHNDNIIDYVDCGDSIGVVMPYQRVFNSGESWILVNHKNRFLWMTDRALQR